MTDLVEPAGAAALLEVKDLRKSFFGVEVLKGMSFRLEAGRVMGVIGENGSGKSTAANIITGLLRPSAGTMFIRGQEYSPVNARDAAAAGIGFIQQELNLFENLTIAENLTIRAFPKRIPWLPQIDRKRMRETAQALLQEVGLDVDPGTPVNQLPQGERQLVEIAKALATDARIIIFDEPTTSLTTREAARLFALVGRLRSRGIGIIYISHILNDVLRLCDDVITLRDGVMVDVCAAAELTVSRMIESMLGRPLVELFPERRKLAAASVPLLEVRGLTQPGIVADISFTVMAGEIVGIAGLMGSGRSEMARILFGLDPAAAGEVRVDGRLVAERSPPACMAASMAYLTENRRADGLMMPEGILANLTLAKLTDLAGTSLAMVPEGRLEREAGEIAVAVRIKAHDLRRQPVRSLSGGNQQRVVVGKWLLRGPKVLVLDEPTRGIDVGAKAEIYALVQHLAERGAAILIISSEFEELFGTCDRILAMAHGEIVAQFQGPAFDRNAVLAATMQTQAGAH
jgi:ribose transport system ATP-binding protein